MTQDEPVVWHYGLMAERWAEFITEAREVPFFLQQIERYGQPVLDVACGTGRVLVPLLGAGIDIDGCDISEDMLRYCRLKADREGYHPSLYNQPMHAFALPRRYRMIYICDSFGLAGSQERDLDALRRCYEHLESGGALVVNIEAEYNSVDSWNLWLPEGRQTLPQPWSEKGEGRIASDGSSHFAQFRVLALDPLDQTYTREVRLEKWSNGALGASEQYVLRGNTYFKNQLLLMLNTAGFRNISLHGGYTDQPASVDDRELIFIATK